MHKALHPYSPDRITVQAHIQEFGNDSLEMDERARCPLCKGRLSNRAASAPGAIGHFAHMPKSGYCPTKDTSGLPYLNKPPRDPDPEAATIIKNTFLTNWPKHFSQLNWIVKGLHVNEFINAIRCANKERIWEYRQLQEYQLPYIFATLMDYPSANSLHINGKPVRKMWFRCWFDTSVKQYEDLWIYRETPLLFWRAWYNNPSRGKPKLEDLVDAYQTELSNEFLVREVEINEFILTTVGSWLTKNFRVA